MANAEMVRIHTYNTKEETKMKNEAMNVRNQLPGGGFSGGEQQTSLPGGGFHGGEQQTSLPGGGFHRDEQQNDPSEGWQKVTLLLENGERADVLIEQDQMAIQRLDNGMLFSMRIHDGHLISELASSFV
jgi:hypothetical protein